MAVGQSLYLQHGPSTEHHSGLPTLEVIVPDDLGTGPPGPLQWCLLNTTGVIPNTVCARHTTPPFTTATLELSRDHNPSNTGGLNMSAFPKEAGRNQAPCRINSKLHTACTLPQQTLACPLSLRKSLTKLGERLLFISPSQGLTTAGGPKD